MSKLKFSLIRTSSALALAVALLAFSFAFGGARASAADMTVCLEPNSILENTADVAEEFDVLCQSFNTDIQAAAAVKTETDTEALAETDHEPAVGSETQQAAAETPDPATTLAIEGQAIQVEITQSVTVAALGQEPEGNEADITGSIAPPTTAGTAPPPEPEAEPAGLLPIV